MYFARWTNADVNSVYGNAAQEFLGLGKGGPCAKEVLSQILLYFHTSQNICTYMYVQLPSYTNGGYNDFFPLLCILLLCT